MSAQRKRSPRVSSKQKLINGLTKDQVDKVLCYNGTKKLGTNPSMQKKKQEIARRHTEDQIRTVLGLKRKSSARKTPAKRKTASKRKASTKKAKKTPAKSKTASKRKSSTRKSSPRAGTKEKLLNDLSLTQLENFACKLNLHPQKKGKDDYVKSIKNKATKAQIAKFAASKK